MKQQEERPVKMGEEDANEYLNGLIQGKIIPIDGMEQNCVQRFRELTKGIEGAQQQEGKVRQQLVQISQDIIRLNGQREAFAQLLIMAEDERRSKVPAPGGEPKADGNGDDKEATDAK